MDLHLGRFVSFSSCARRAHQLLHSTIHYPRFYSTHVQHACQDVLIHLEGTTYMNDIFFSCPFPWFSYLPPNNNAILLPFPSLAREEEKRKGWELIPLMIHITFHSRLHCRHPQTLFLFIFSLRRGLWRFVPILFPVITALSLIRASRVFLLCTLFHLFPAFAVAHNGLFLYSLPLLLRY